MTSTYKDMMNLDFRERLLQFKNEIARLPFQNTNSLIESVWAEFRKVSMCQYTMKYKPYFSF